MGFLDAALISIPFLTGLPLPAQALKERNEALCGTGFFENYNPYRCTDIGDILDEGTSSPLSQSEEAKLDSLMSKFGDITIEDDNKSTRNNAASGQKDGEGTKQKRGGK